MRRALSPRSIPYRVVERGGGLLVTAFFLFSSASAILGPRGELVALVLAGLAGCLLVGYEVAYHRRFAYALTGDTLDIQSGVIARRSREIPIKRVQNVDISRNIVQRLLSIAVVDFETAGGSETEATLRCVSFEEAKRLQREVRRLKAGEADEESADAETATATNEGTELFALARRELALVGALSFDLRIPGLLFVFLTGGVPVLSSVLPSGSELPVVVAGLVAAVVVALVSWLAGATVAVLNYYDFRLSRVGDELQYERGLLRRYDGSIPLDKVQTLTITDDPLKRYFGYASLRIGTAGYAPGAGESGSEAAIPLANRDRVFALANRIEPFGSPSFERPPKRVRRRYTLRYLIVLGLVTGVLHGASLVFGWPFPWPTVTPLVLAPLAPVAAHLSWRHRGVWLGDHHVVTRNGFFRRRITVVPYYRIQTVIDSRTVFQRRWGVATVTADTAGSASFVSRGAAAVDVDVATAETLRDELETRFRTALAARRGWGDDDGDGAAPSTDD
ncbi:putative membrane protein [Haloplanus vescus]|uniref:Putative membrane protein n=1 Tax=Haloplanus vescus TaxID=555874 RepID=A0A1H3VV12_9EURY|nr:PH domain-containing protein [Haloplanus vescus]SDZ78673.1 putative membrane protein [Haloplanus vescus]